MNNKIVYGALAVLVVLVGGLYFRSLSFGAVPGTYHTNAEEFAGGVTLSGTNTLSGATNVTGAFTATADVRAKSPVFTGSIGSVSGTTSSVITAAQVCDNNYATTTPSITEASTLTTPSAVTLFADCLTTNGDVAFIYVRNTTASTTVVTAGASTTLVFDGSTGGSATLAASSVAFLRFIRTSATTLYAIMDQYKP